MSTPDEPRADDAVQEFVDLPADPPADLPVKELLAEPVDHLDQPAPPLVAESAEQPVAEATEAPTAEATEQPAVESTDAPVAESTNGDIASVSPEHLEHQGPPVPEVPASPLDDPAVLRSAVEAILLVVDSPTNAMTFAQVLDRPVAEVEAALTALRSEYDAGGRGIDLREVAGGWRLYTRSEFAGYIERFVLDGQQARLTQASLETLSVVAYRQPVTRSRVSAIRGVNVDAVMRTLLTRGLIEECGSDPETGGGLYQTTQLFLEKLGLRSLDELPSLAPLLPDTSQLDDVALSS